jgi:peptide-methionine (S)-S-oxide reductase
VGYAGGTTPSPNYHNVGDYSETVRVAFDPDIVSYEQLLAVFWSSHDPAIPPYSLQYKSAIFCTTDQQAELAIASKQAEEERLDKTVFTVIQAGANFYVAEDYHQKYYLRGWFDLANELYAIYPDPAEFRDSTAAARLNGYIAGYGSTDTIENNIGRLGLSALGQQALLQLTGSAVHTACPADFPTD